ncbi:7-cyano-7-deazaguanine synthase [Nocardioides sp. XL1]|uniref:7-cyano-7-deazaguanine synthase n=1 Tax=Nocardioides sp. XL1 TaxID=2003120 RepID=UPI0000EB61B3|nr:7-cyano-7-deazaguanine synthase [Nocardioides sp. XL1]ABL80613.1 preQ(0) biosynthesis protein QueC [Nocardioides sp. JS614]
MKRPATDICVLLSGGVDSALVLAMLSNRSPVSVWVDYGQPVADVERQASRAIANHFGSPWMEVVIKGLAPPASGEFLGRNDLLVAAALSVAGGGFVAIGTHAGTGYADCSLAWAGSWQALLDAQHGGTAGLLAPLSNLDKAQVYELAVANGVPIELTHSCETTAAPCGSCSSCADRRLLDAGA